MALVCLRSGRRGNHLGIRAGKELALVTVVPPNPIMLTGRPPHHLQDLAISPSGVDRDRLDDDPVSLVCVHKALCLPVLGPAASESAPDVELLPGLFGVLMGVKIKVRVVVQYLEDPT